MLNKAFRNSLKTNTKKVYSNKEWSLDFLKEVLIEINIELCNKKKKQFIERIIKRTDDKFLERLTRDIKCKPNDKELFLKWFKQW